MTHQKIIRWLFQLICQRQNTEISQMLYIKKKLRANRCCLFLLIKFPNSLFSYWQNKSVSCTDWTGLVVFVLLWKKMAVPNWKLLQNGPRFSSRTRLSCTNPTSKWWEKYRICEFSILTFKTLALQHKNMIHLRQSLVSEWDWTIFVNLKDHLPETTY
jgi:hypothetical protein